MPAPSPNSIRRALVVRLVGPLLLLTFVAGIGAYAIALHFSSNVLDNWLRDSAVSLANRVHWHDEDLAVDLPEGAREMLEWDLVDRVFYEVLTTDGRRVDGNILLPAPPTRLTRTSPAVFYDAYVNQTRVRVFAFLLYPDATRSAIVKVAETQQKRSSLAWQVLWISVAVSLMFALLSGTLLWQGISSGIASMEDAVRDVRKRDPHRKLEPIAPTAEVPEELVPLIEQIDSLIADLSASHRVTERFIVNAAHQLRTPVTTLRTGLETAIRENDSARRDAAMRDAVAIVGYMSHMLHQLLTLARADEKSTHPELQSHTDVARIARDAVERRVDDALALGVDLGYEGPSTPVPVIGDAGLLREALANMLDNALRYGASGRVVTVGVVDGPEPEFYVEDRGPGIPAHERPRIGNRFYRLPGTPGEGCGLGLSIVTEIARLFGGRLVLEDGPSGIGLRARVVLVAAGTPPGGPAPASDRALADSTPHDVDALAGHPPG